MPNIGPCRISASFVLTIEPICSAIAKSPSVFLFKPEKTLFGPFCLFSSPSQQHAPAAKGPSRIEAMLNRSIQKSSWSFFFTNSVHVTRICVFSRSQSSEKWSEAEPKFSLLLKALIWIYTLGNTVHEQARNLKINSAEVASATFRSNSRRTGLRVIASENPELTLRTGI